MLLIQLIDKKNMIKSTFLIAGKHAVTEALKNPNRRVLKIFLTEDSKKTLNKENQNYQLLKGIKIFYKNKKELDRLCSKEQISHQGLIAEIEDKDEIHLGYMIVSDPQFIKTFQGGYQEGWKYLKTKITLPRPHLRRQTPDMPPPHPPRPPALCSLPPSASPTRFPPVGGVVRSLCQIGVR